MARQTPLNAVHRELGGRMVDFAGWDMPVQYSSIIGEHETVRTAVGLFDVSHMGEIEFSGPGALETANKLITNDLSKCADGQALYAGLLNDAGGFVDDVVAYRFSPERILIVVNASNKDKDFAWMRARAEGVQPVDRSDDYAQIAVQGPKAVALVQRLTPVDLTGYTGEDGFELYCAPGDAAALWRALLEEGAADGVKPCGLGARDSLRVEMKYALYGNDIDETHTALEAGLGWICKLDKAGGFIGRDALVKQKAEGVKRKLVGLEVTGSGIARHGYPLLKDGQRVGEVTSGTQGPSVKKPIAFGYVPVELAAEGATLDVEIRGRAVPVVVVKTPFLKKK
jgi:aminomethyltransferase